MQRRVAGTNRLDDVGYVVLELRAIGDVQVHIQHRVPTFQQAQHRLHLRSIRLGVVPVEIEILGSGTPAHLLGTILIGAVPAAESLVPVNVEHRHEHQHERFQCARRCFAGQHLPRGQKTGVLAIDFACVDAALNQHHRCFAFARVLGREHARSRHDECKHRPALWRAAKFRAAHRIRPGARISAAQPLDFIVTAGDPESRALGDGLE
jgi:hypothetical protein